MIDRPVLLYVPGLDGTARLLFRQTALDAAYRVVPSPYPQNEPRTYDQLADEAADRLRAALADAGESAGVVLAESFGGAVALRLALREPALVRRLVLVNTFAYFSRRRMVEFAAWFSRGWPARPGPPWARHLRAPFFFSPDIPADVRAEWWRRTGPVPMAGFAYRIRLVAGLDLRPRLADVRVPTLVVVAPDDRLVPPASGRLLARSIPGARLVHARVGHAALVHPRFDLARLLADPRWQP